MSRIEGIVRKRIHMALKAFTVAALAAATFFVVSADPVVAFDSGCDQRCTDRYGECRQCHGPWHPYFGTYTRCIEGDHVTTCVYACGRTSCQRVPK